MVVQPASPRGVIRASLGDERPEPRAVTEDPEVGELVDDDRLEGLGRRQDEAPRERQAAGTRCAAPAGSWVAQCHSPGCDAHRRGMTRDGPVDRRTGAFPQPRFEERRVGPTLASRTPDQQAVAEVVAEPLDRGASGTDRRRRHRHAMELAEVADLAAITRSPACGELRPDPRVSIEMAADPALAFAEELNGPSLPIGSPGAVGGHRHDHAALRMDDDPERAGAWGLAKREGDGTAGQVRDGRRLEGSGCRQQVVALRSITRR
jgi:hypothetical protein